MKGRTVLLTGATGFLGAHLLAELLAAGAAEVRCLVRAPDAHTALRRLRAAASRQGLTAPVGRRVRAVPGDLARPSFGLTAGAFAALGRGVDLVIHAGAQVSLALPYESLKPVNVGGTREVLRLAAEQGTPVHHISTLSVLGTTGPDEALRLPEASGLGSGYAQSKWVADRLVAAAGERGLPVAVHRTGRLFVNSTTGGHNPDDLLVQVLAAALRLGVAPDLDAVLRLGPVDWVSSVICALAAHPAGTGRAYHLTGLRPLEWSGLLDAVAAAGHGLARARYPHWRDVLTETAGRTGDGTLTRPALVLGGRPPFTRGTDATAVNARAVLGDAFTEGYPPSETQLLTRLCETLATDRARTGR
ncbi:thioester reductase domain-containing protein [Streptomyces sp. FH025]|uniref:thioester reductase domain-containing protein n=1 Tax=Streptomyces sp. FH025 TaxID=2815937 RepID=UPI001A9D6C58|nr:thioester reductase domain-containing protein [Streptomyces sp. FH025]MBO1419215.1 thioester reductase domain-containing protein [Streptomyces sp. FH025]